MGWVSGKLDTIELSPKLMGSHEEKKADPSEELPDEWWHKVYAAVVLTTIVVITLLWSFSRYFSG